MTIFLWDASHYDGTLTPSILRGARAEGIAGFTHKIAEGLNDTEGTHDDTALAAARDAGIEFIGGYLVPRSNASVTAQVDYWLRLADAGEPWWRNFPGWFWQVDLERWSYDNVPASVGIAAAQQLRARTGRWVILYASHGQYGDQLTGWNGPLWNAHYTSRAAGSVTAMYPGDNWMPSLGGGLGGWAAYSGRAPTFLQYTSSATIAGLTTCDASAFRGDARQLRALIEGGTIMVTFDDAAERRLESAEAHAWAIRTGERPNTWINGTTNSTNNGNPLWDLVNSVKAEVLAVKALLNAPQPAVDVNVLADKISQALIASNTNGLTTADHVAIKDDISKVLLGSHIVPGA